MRLIYEAQIGVLGALHPLQAIAGRGKEGKVGEALFKARREELSAHW